MAPEKVTNPVLSRFCHAIRDLAIDAESPIPEEAPLLDLLLNPPKIEARDMALGRVAKQFAVQIKVNDNTACLESVPACISLYPSFLICRKTTIIWTSSTSEKFFLLTSVKVVLYLHLSCDYKILELLSE